MELPCNDLLPSTDPNLPLPDGQAHQGAERVAADVHRATADEATAARHGVRSTHGGGERPPEV